jgi:hypothetical protein
MLQAPVRLIALSKNIHPLYPPPPPFHSSRSLARSSIVKFKKVVRQGVGAST